MTAEDRGRRARRRRPSRRGVSTWAQDVELDGAGDVDGAAIGVEGDEVQVGAVQVRGGAGGWRVGSGGLMVARQRSRQDELLLPWERCSVLDG